MNITKLHIENYKGFEQLDVVFNKNLNVFIGENASGKTSLLTAIIKALYNITFDFAKANKYIENKLLLQHNDINYYSKECEIEININNFSNYNKTIKSVLTNKDIGKVNQVSTFNEFVASQKEDNNLNNFKKWFYSQISIGTTTIPVIKYYPAKRNSIKSEISNFDAFNVKGNYNISQLETWAYMYQDNVSFDSFFKWFYENETQELRLQKVNENSTIESPSLKDVRKAIKKTLDFLGYKKSEIISDQFKKPGNSEFIQFLKIQNEEGDWENLHQKSDGEKAIITLVSDIAYNLSLAKDFINDDDFLKSKGVILIDEIENHLHPNWQRKIIPLLTEVFPNIQFFITTHSPQVIGSVKSENIFKLKNFKISKLKYRTEGEDSNSLLKHIFNSTEREEGYFRLIEKLDKLIEEGKPVDKLEKLVKEIQEKFEDDKSISISNIIEELNLRIEAYKFERDYEKN